MSRKPRTISNNTLRLETGGKTGHGDGACTWKVTAGMALALAAVTAVSYCGVAGNGFVDFDDGQYVTGNSHVNKGLSWEGIKWALTSSHAGNWHPLTWISHMLDVQVFGLEPGGHHIVNLGFHIINTLLLFGFLHYATGRQWASIFVAGLFALHPLHVESVAWVSERKDVLSTFFWMAAMWCYAFYVKKPSILRYVGVTLLFAMGLMSKAMLVGLPLVLLLLDYWPLERFAVERQAGGWRASGKSIAWLVVEKVPLMILAGLASLVALATQRGAMPSYEMLDLPSRLTNAVISYWRYVREMVWPQGLAGLYPYPNRPLYGEAVLASLLLLCAFAVVLSLGRKHKYVPVGVLWYLITLVPVIGLVQVGIQSHADRYTYVPLTGLFIVISWGTAELTVKYAWLRKPVGIGAAAVLFALGIVTWRTTGFWKDNGTLFGRALSVTKDNYRMMSNLGVHLTATGQLDKGLALLEKSQAIRPNDAYTLSGLGTALCRKGRYEEAVQYYKAALIQQPDLEQVWYNMGLTTATLGRHSEAAACFEKCVKLSPDWVEAYSHLGEALCNSGRPGDGLTALRKVVELSPGDAAAHVNVAIVLQSLGRRDEAIAEMKRAIELDPQDARIQADYKALTGGGQ